MDSIRHKTKELLTYHYGCYGNLVTIATKYVADVYHPIEPPYQMWTKNDLIFTHRILPTFLSDRILSAQDPANFASLIDVGSYQSCSKIRSC